MTFHVWLTDTAERVLLTFIEAFVGILLVGPTLDFSTAQAGLAAGIVAGFVVVKQALTVYLPAPPDWRLDAAVRVAWSFLQAFAGVMAVVHVEAVFTVSAWEAAGAAGLVAAGAAVKTIVASRISNTVSPASLARAG